MADLKVLLGVDIDPSITQIESDLKKIKPQIDGKLKIALNFDLTAAEKQIESISSKINKSNINKNVVADPYRIASDELKKLYDLKTRYLKLSDPSSEAGNFYKQQIVQQQSIYERSIPDGSSYNAKQANDLTLLRLDLENKLEIQLNKTAQAIIKKDKAEIDAANKAIEVEQRKIDLLSKSTSSPQSSQDILKIEKVNQQVEILQSRIDRAKVSWSKMLSSPEVMAQVSKIEDGLQNVGGDPQKYQALNREWQLLANNIAVAGNNQKNFGDRVAETSSKLAAYLVNMATYTLVLVNLKNAVQAVKELDSSLVEIRKVTDLSGDALLRFTDRAFEAASKIGRTGKDLVDATAEFVRAGYALESAFDLGRASLIMTNIGDGIRSVEDASSALIAVLRGFKISDADVMDVVDAINEVSNTAPITFRDLTEGMRRVSGTLSQTGTDINQTMALLTGGFAQLRDIEGVSSGLLMIFQRLRGVTEDGEKIDGLMPKLQADFKRIAGIDISKGNGELRSTYEILSDMAKIFPTLTEEQRQYLGEMAAGNRQVRVLNAILSGWDDVENAVESALNSSNSATIENMKFMDSIEGKTQVLQSSFQKLSNSVIDSEMIKFLLDITNGFINLISVADHIPAKLIAITIATVALTTAIKSVTAQSLINSFTGTFKDLILFIPNAVKQMYAYQSALASISVASDVAVTKMQIMTATIKGLGASLLASPLFWVTAIAGATMALNTYNKSLEESKQAILDKAKTNKEELDSINELISKYNELKSSETQDDFTRSQIKEIQEQITSLVGKQAENLDLVNGNLESQLDTLYKISAEQAKQALPTAEAAKIVAQKDFDLGTSVSGAPGFGFGITFGEDAITSALRKTGEIIPRDESYLTLLNGKNAKEIVETLTTWQESFLSLGDVGANALGMLTEQIAFYDAKVKALNETLDRPIELAMMASESYYLLSENQLTFLDKFLKDTELISSEITNFVDNLAENNELQKAINELFSIDELQSLAKVEELKNAYLEFIADAINGDKETLKVKLGFDFDTEKLIENVIEVRPILASFRDQLSQEFSQTELELMILVDKEPFTVAANNITELRTEFDAWQESISNSARDATFTKSLEELKNQTNLLSESFKEQSEYGVISQETYKSLISASDEYKKLVKETSDGFILLSDEANNYINELVALAVQQGVLNDFTKEQIAEMTKLFVDIQNLNDQLDIIQSSYKTVATAIDEYNESGSVSIDTFQALLKLSPEYLSTLDLENGKLIINEQSARNLTDALKEEAIVKLQNAAISDILAIANGNLDSASEFVKGTVKALGENLRTAGGEAAESAEGFTAAAASIAAIKAVASEQDISDEIATQIDAVFNAYSDNINKIASLKIDFSELSKGSKSSSKKKKTEPYKVEIDQTKLLEARLQKVNELLTQNDKLFNSSKSNKDTQSELLQKRIELLEEQKSLLHQINEANRSTINNNIKNLSDYGIHIKYIPEINLIEFEQSTDEIQEVLNGISIGDIENTNEVKKELESMLDTINKMNESNDKNSSQWLEIQQTIRQISLDLINIEYNEFLNKTADELSVLETQLKLLGDNKFDEKITVITSQLELQKTAVERDNEQLKILQNALFAGTITSEQFKQETDQLNKSMQEAALSAKQYSDSINQIKLDQLSQQKSAINSIVDLVKQMIQQEIKDLNDADTVRINALKDQNDLLKEQLNKEKEIASEKKKALDDELSRYKEIIDAKKRSLDLTKEERYYEQQLNEKTLSVTKIQDRLAEIANNDSLSAQAERAKLQEELAQRQLELDNFVFDNNIDKQKEALDSEYERYQKLKDAEKDLIDSNLKIYEDMINQKMKLNDDEAEQFRRIIEERNNSIANNGELVRMAMERIDKEGSALYQKLVAWNHIYGTGIEEDITSAWQDYLDLVDMGNMTTLEKTRNIMQDILSLTREIANAQSQLNYFSSTTGLRDFFEGAGYDVGWNANTGQFSVGDNWYDSSNYINVDDHLQATWQQLDEILRNMNSYDSGGFIKTDQIAKIHTGERILRPIETTDLHTLLPRMSVAQEEILNGLKPKTSLVNKTINSLTPVEIVQHNTLKVDGIATEQVADKLDKKLVAFGTDIIRKINTAANSLGGTPTIKAF